MSKEVDSFTTTEDEKEKRIVAFMPAPGWRAFACIGNKAHDLEELPVIGWALYDTGEVDLLVVGDCGIVGSLEDTEQSCLNWICEKFNHEPTEADKEGMVVRVEHKFKMQQARRANNQ